MTRISHPDSCRGHPDDDSGRKQQKLRRRQANEYDTNSPQRGETGEIAAGTDAGDPLQNIAETYLENPVLVTSVHNMFGYTGT